jgi:hypothetical protein
VRISPRRTGMPRNDCQLRQPRYTHTPSDAICWKALRSVSLLPLSAICISIFSRSTGAVAVRLTAPAMPATSEHGDSRAWHVV